MENTQGQSGRIDAHQHFWRYTPEEYDWIDETMAAIRRDFLPSDLRTEMTAAGVESSIAVQARPDVDETEWLLALADAHPWIAGVVGWAPLTDAGLGGVLERLAENPKLRGIRQGLQTEPDAYMEREDFNAGLERLPELGLAYDILIVHRQLPAATRLVDRHPGQVFVLDHIAKPAIREGTLEPWARDLKELARRPHVFCKLSGVVTEAAYAGWTYEEILPYMETALEAFGPERLLFGSDWPVCRVAAEHGAWMRCVERFAVRLSDKERQALFRNNAVRAYGM